MSDEPGEREKAIALLERTASQRVVKSAAIVCPGPSLELFATCGGRDAFEVVMAVNRAAAFLARGTLDYWISLDSHTPNWIGAEEIKKMPPRTIVASKQIYGQVKQCWPPLGVWRHLDHTTLQVPAAIEGLKWRRFGMTVGVALAASLGCKRIDVFGADWSGQADLDGFTDPKQKRTADRWALERKIFGQLATALEPGVAVCRHTPVAAGTE